MAQEPGNSSEQQFLKSFKEYLFINGGGGVSYALFISLFISKLFCTKGEGGPLEGVVPKNHKKLTTQHAVQNTDAAKLVYIKLPMYRFF